MSLRTGITGERRIRLCTVSAVNCISDCIAQAVGALLGFDLFFFAGFLDTLTPAVWIVCSLDLLPGFIFCIFLLPGG